VQEVAVTIYTEVTYCEMINIITKGIYSFAIVVVHVVLLGVVIHVFMKY